MARAINQRLSRCLPLKCLKNSALKSIAAPVQGVDLFPTILRLAGEDPKLPKGSPAVDLSRLLFEPTAAVPPELRADRLLAFQCARMGYQTPQSHKDHVVTGFTDGRCKYIYEQYESPRRLLYDLTIDPGEQSPLTQGPEVDTAHERLLALRPDLPRR